jgi:hypothetical protein
MLAWTPKISLDRAQRCDVPLVVVLRGSLCVSRKPALLS